MLKKISEQFLPLGYLAWYTSLCLVWTFIILYLFKTSTPETIRNDVGIFFSISSVFLAIYIAADLRYNTKTRERQEHQHYKQRLLAELDHFLFLTGLIVTLDQRIKKNQEENTEIVIKDEISIVENIKHAEGSIIKLRTINSDFNIPSEIRSRFDEILSDYDSFLESLEHKCLPKILWKNAFSEEGIKLRDFLNTEFIRKNNNNFIKEKLQSVDQQLSKIIDST